MRRTEATFAAVLAFLAGISIGVCINRAAPSPAPARLIAPTNLTATPRASVPPVNRSFARLPIGPTDHLAFPVGRTQPSPSASPLRRSVATRSPAAVTPPAAAGPSALRDAIEWCESRDNPTAQNPRSTASGLYGFLDTTWHAVTGLPGHARNYPPDVQIAAFDALYAQQGTRPWNASRACWEARLQ